MFGPRFLVSISGLVIEMGPPRDRSEVEAFAELMSSPRVSRYLGRRGGCTIDDEHEWYENSRTDKSSVGWLLFDVTGGARTLIGSTNLHAAESLPLPTMVSGYMVGRPEYWGRAIAKTTHRVRTWYAFNCLGLSCVRSGVMATNEGSRRALESVGYVVVSIERNLQFDDGKLIHKLNLECVNPDSLMWRRWWHGDDIPESFRDARKRTQKAIEWVRKEVRPFDS